MILTKADRGHLKTGGRDSAGRDEIMRLLKYDSEAGVITWRVNRGRSAKAGDVAGTVGETGHRTIRIRGSAHSAGRVAWLMHNGCWPKGTLNYMDGVGSNIEIKNLEQQKGKR